MPNWCSNRVTFEGEQHQITDLQILFETLSRREQKERKGQLPNFIFERDGYFFDIHWEDSVLYYETKWSPNTSVIMEIAVRFDVDFVHSYEEGGCLIYGEASFIKGVFTDTCLDPEDFALYLYHEADDTCTFEGNEYESRDEVLEILLERKKAINSL
jgi:hypothetical protein